MRNYSKKILVLKEIKKNKIVEIIGFVFADFAFRYFKNTRNAIVSFTVHRLTQPVSEISKITSSSSSLSLSLPWTFNKCFFLTCKKLAVFFHSSHLHLLDLSNSVCLKNYSKKNLNLILANVKKFMTKKYFNDFVVQFFFTIKLFLLLM